MQILALIGETIEEISQGTFGSPGELIIWSAWGALLAFFYIKGAYGNARRHLRIRRARFDMEQMRIDSRKGPIFRWMARHDVI